MKPGNVISSTPAGGAEVECESTITLLVSKGPNLVSLPSVLGRQQEEAQSTLERLGFIVNVDTRDADEPEGTVIAQDPGPGSRLLRGDNVTIVVSTGAGAVIVPDVVGQSEDAARSLLSSRGLSIDVIDQDTEERSEDGRVLRAGAGGRVARPRWRLGDDRGRQVHRTDDVDHVAVDHHVVDHHLVDDRAGSLMRVAVLRGGRSSEHEVSLQSGAAVAAGLREAGHDVVEVLIARDGRWTADGEEVEMRAGAGLLGCEVAFPVLHGPFGEDGTVQGLLETPRRRLRGPRRARRGGRDGQADLQAAARLRGAAAGRVLRGRRGWLARAGGGNAATAVGEAVSARLERRDLARRGPRGGARQGGRGGRGSTTPG